MFPKGASPVKEPSPMKSINASFSAMSKILTHMGKAMRLERELEAQENERRLRTRDLKNAAEALDKRHASPHSRRVVLTGLHEYWRVISTHSQPEPAATISPSVPGLVLSDIVAQPVAWLWQDYLPLGALTLLEGEPGSGTSLLALHIAACVTGGHALPGGTPGTLASDLHVLEEAVARTHAALLILDSLDTCRPNDLRQALPALAQLAQRSGCAILLVRPIAPGPPAAAPKPGSLELLAAVRSSLLLQSDPEDQQRQRLLLVTKHALCAQPGILSFQLCAGEQGILALDWLGVYTHPAPPYQHGDLPLLSCRNRSLLHQRIVSALHASAAPMNARSLTTITGFTYELVRKTLRRMFDDGDLACPARGLYTTPGHPCLAQPAAPTS